MSGEQRKAVIKNADMTETMQQDAVDVASKALSDYNIEKVRCRADRAFLFQRSYFHFALCRTWRVPLKRNSIRNMVQHGEFLCLFSGFALVPQFPKLLSFYLHSIILLNFF
jgi:hypothetical protein